jgi:pimeloyl-ACP methyl ester carboxylesterase
MSQKPYEVPEDIYIYSQKHVGARGFFFAGGKYVEDGKSRLYKYGQVYVEVFVPVEISQPYPLVLFHAGNQTGVSWMGTPDGRKGWADFYVEKGYVVYVVDLPGRGRSVYHSEDGKLARMSGEHTKMFLADGEGYWPAARLHTQWPTGGELDEWGYDRVYDSLFSSQVGQISIVRMQEVFCDTGPALLEKTGPAILMTHSMSGACAWVTGDRCSEKVKCIVAIEPSGPPFLAISITTGMQRAYGITDIPLSCDPPLRVPIWRNAEPFIAPSLEDESAWLQPEPAGQFVNLAKVPVMVVSAEASYHSQFDHLTVAFMRQAGIKVDYYRLQDYGIYGNGHMMNLEKNNLEIAEFLYNKFCEKIQ